MNPTGYEEFVEEDLPLPSFQEVFGFAIQSPSIPQPKKRPCTNRIEQRSSKKTRDITGEETTG